MLSDGKQGVPLDRMLMRIKDFITIVGILSTWIVGCWFGLRFMVRFVDRISSIDAVQQQQQKEINVIKGRLRLP